LRIELVSLVKRALNKSCRGRGTSVYPTATSLISVPEIDAQSLDKDHRLAEEHLKRNTKQLPLLQPVSQIHWGPNLNASMQMHIAWGIKKRS